MAIYKLTEWEGAAGWYCGDVSALGKDSNRWEHGPRSWQMEPVAWVKMLVEKYHANVSISDSGMVHFHWKKQSDMRKYKNDTNKQARLIGYET